MPDRKRQRSVSAAPAEQLHPLKRLHTETMGSSLIHRIGRNASWPDHRAQIDNNDWYGRLSRNDFEDAGQVVSHIREIPGEHRCPFGSTPQLLATLYAESEFTWKDTIAKGCPTWTETEEHEKLAKGLWENEDYYSQQGYSKTDSYSGEHYDGENALHLAIVKKRGDLVHYFLSRASEGERKTLLESHATGNFPINYITVDLGKCKHRGCAYGETPLCWAACTGQREIFEYLVQMGADISCVVNNTGDTILHMLVRLTKETPKDMDVENDEEREAAEMETERFTEMYDVVIESAARAETSYGGKKLGLPDAESLDGMRVVLLGAEANRRYGTLVVTEEKETRIRIEGHSGEAAVRKTGCGDAEFEADELVVEVDGKWRKVVEDLQYMLNKQGLTPLTLAAREGSKGIFEHLIHRKLQPMWMFGPEIGVSLCLRDIDQDFSRARKHKKAGEPYVFSILVRSERGDLLDLDVMRAFLDSKWSRYAQAIAHSIFAQTCVLLFCFFDLRAVGVMRSAELLAQLGVRKEFAFLQLSFLLLAIFGFNFFFALMDAGLTASSFAREYFQRTVRSEVGGRLQVYWLALSIGLPLCQLILRAGSLRACGGWRFMAAAEFSVWTSLIWLNYLPSRAWGKRNWWRAVLSHFKHMPRDDKEEARAGDRAGQEEEEEGGKRSGTAEEAGAGEGAGGGGVRRVLRWVLRCGEEAASCVRGPREEMSEHAAQWTMLALPLLDAAVHLAALCLLVHASGAYGLLLDACDAAAAPRDAGGAPSPLLLPLLPRMDAAVGTEEDGIAGSYAVTSLRMKSASAALLLLGSFRFFSLELREVLHLGLREYVGNQEGLLDVVQNISGFLLFPLGAALLVGLRDPFGELLVSLGFCVCCFFRLLFYLLGFERYGHLLHLVWGMRRDVVTVVVIYFAVTVGFSVTFAITDVASSHLSDAEGGRGGEASLLLSLKHYFWNSLNAFAGGGLEDEGNWQMTDPRIQEGTHLITGLTINLLRFISQLIAPLVLVNLLIAMMGRKYEVFRDSEEQQWQLARARIIQSIDDEFAESLFNGDARNYADFLLTRKMDLSIALKGSPDQRRRYLQKPTRGADELKQATRRLQQARGAPRQTATTRRSAAARSRS